MRSVKMASSAGLEPTTACLEGKSSIRLSYEDTLTSARGREFESHQPDHF